MIVALYAVHSAPLVVSSEISTGRVPPLLRIARCVPPFSCTFPVVLQLKGFEKKDSRDSWPFSKTMVILIIDVDAAK